MRLILIEEHRPELETDWGAKTALTRERVARQHTEGRLPRLGNNFIAAITSLIPTRNYFAAVRNEIAAAGHNFIAIPHYFVAVRSNFPATGHKFIAIPHYFIAVRSNFIAIKLLGDGSF